MAGLIITPRQEDFERLTPELALSIYVAKGEVITGPQTVEFSEGGILWRGTQYRELTFTPQAPDATFSLSDVTIGVDFHWERKETQEFEGTLRIVVEADKIVAINELPVERYLTSVIASEMSPTASIEFLKAHAVISRSWLLAQMGSHLPFLAPGTNGEASPPRQRSRQFLLVHQERRRDHPLVRP